MYKQFSLLFLVLIVFSGCMQKPTIGQVAVDESKIPIKLYVYDCGHIQAKNMSLFDSTLKSGIEAELANTCYLIEHPKGKIFWDAGLPDELYGVKGGENWFNGSFNMQVKKTLTSQFQESGVDPKDIDYLVFSHLHNDHTGNAKLFQNSIWVMQQKEYEIAFGPMAKKYGYNPDFYKFDSAQKMKLLDGDFDFFDDGSVLLISTPGHSPGHQSLIVKLPKTGTVFISGDCFVTYKHKENYGIPIWGDKKSSIHSFVKIDNLLERTKATLWIPHDKALFDSQKHTPEYYE
ncbi:MAG: N-acyl homoserine lactonase family protein [Sulfurimonas sp.]